MPSACLNESHERRNTLRTFLPKLLAGMLLWLFYAPAYGALPCSSITATSVTFAQVAFGTASNQTLTSTVTSVCTGNPADTDLIVIGPGANFSGTSRRMFSAASGQFLSYTVRQPNTTLWGGDPVTGLPNTLGTAFLIFRGTTTILATVSVSVPDTTPAGTYTDSVIVNSPNNAGKTGTFTVSITITNSCMISSPPSAINFGNAAAGSPGASVLPRTATIGIRCNTGLAYVWGANSGLNWSGSKRRMSNGANFIAYDLRESGVLLGDTGMAAFGGSNTTTGINFRSGYTGNSNQQSYTISATVAESTIPSALGTYSDTVVYTVGW